MDLKSKTYIKISFFILMGLIFVGIDKRCQDYGIPAILFEKTYPMNLKPCFVDYAPLHFVFLDKDGFEYIGKGFKYRNIPFSIDSIMSYGYNSDSSVVVKCIGSDRDIHILEFSSYGTVQETPDNIKISSMYNLDIDTIWHMRALKNSLIVLFILCSIYLIKKTNWMKYTIIVFLTYMFINFIALNHSAIKEIWGL